MKTYWLILLTFFQCSVFAQTNKPAPEDFPDCPPQTCPGIHVTISIRNFHKPRTNCTSGLGICLRITAYLDCIPCGNKSYVENGKATIYGTIKEDQVVLDIPASLLEEKEFENERFDSFEIGDKSFGFTLENGKYAYLRGGTYALKKDEDGFQVTIPLAD